MKNQHKLLSGLVAIALCLASTPIASAIIITPSGNTFGSLPAATFGGTGIPNDAVQITRIGDLILGLSATPRYGNAALTNDSAGTFFAVAGGDLLNAKPNYAKWNFDFYVSGIGAGQTTKLYYDNHASVGNDVGSFYPGYNANFQDSWNLGFGFLNGGIFNPNTNGEYGFALVAFDAANVEIGRSAILVKVSGGTSVPDGGSMVVMLGAAFLGLAALRRRFAA
jgi:hypothetical protein